MPRVPAYRVRAAKRGSGKWEILFRGDDISKVQKAQRKILAAGDHVLVLIETGDGDLISGLHAN